MTLKQYLILILIITVVCWAGWLMVIFFINPLTASNLVLSLFYASLFLALSGTLSIIGLLYRLVFDRQYSKSEKAEVSFRQSIFFSLIICLALFLQAERLLNWFNIILLVLVVTIIEFLIISLKRERKTPPVPESNNLDNNLEVF